MATYNTQSIKVPIETQLQVKDTIEGIKRLRAELEKQFKNVDPASSLGKSLARLRAKIDQSFANIDASNLGSELFDEGDFKKVLNYVNQINQQLQQMRVQGTTATAKALGIDTQEIEEATKKLQELKDEYRQFKNRSVEKDNPAELARFEQHKKATGFNAKHSYQKNIEHLTATEQRLDSEIAALNTEESIAAREEARTKFEEAKRLAETAKAEHDAAVAALAEAKAEQDKQKRANADYNTAQSLKNVDTHTHPGRGRAEIIKGYKDKIDENIVTKGGNLKKGGKEFARTVATWLDMSEGEIETLLGNRAEVIATQLKEKLDAAMAKNMRPFISKIQAADAAGYNGEELAKANAAVVQAQNKEAAAQLELNTKNTALEVAENEHKKAVKLLDDAQTLLKEVWEQIALLKTYRQRLKDSADLHYESQIEDAEKAVETAQQESTRETREQQTSTSTRIAEEAKRVNQTYQETHQGNQDSENAKRERERAEKAIQAQIEAENRKQKQDAEQFKQNLQHTINQWMSAQQVINIVKDGIRQAYQDIQGLDAAMTNIAVVTDMSVGDLWGKINEYMSIAQQYGVTTQGVYEVSQLYYQQGLSTNEVMAATTETLKMARIAGMGYAEAADAMTVAIRAFKMEMDDAGHVTDVYSKVAAVTASDTEELAIAMSKTASSAESVGSSFENTTAMLAVMVETTRESAQNLGSALKSIISRYGEMKQGLTQDSNGEIIDYNKTDAALRSIGISIKDAQGQFRDFDDVIFELSAKWDSLDKNTQRYIATIMAGNRQQSRFIALVDNWERLNEVATAAQDSEDAGLLQYAKTLDSLDTKINNLKTSFQEFYMNIANGPLISGVLDGLNRLLQGFNKLGSLQGVFNLAGILRGLKTGLKLIVNTFGSSFSNIISSWKNVQAQWLTLARQSGYERGYEEAKAEAEGRSAYINGQGAKNVYGSEKKSLSPSEQRAYNKAHNKPRGYVTMRRTERSEAYNNMSFFERRMAGRQTGKTSWSNNSWNNSSWGQGLSVGGAIAGSALSAWGASAAQESARKGAVISGLGNVAQGVSMGAMFGPWGAVIGGVVGGLASLPSILKAFDPANILKEKLAKAEEALKEAELEKAQKTETAKDLESTINNLRKLQEARYDSEEAEAAFIEASNAAAEKFPQLISGYTTTGDAIIDVVGEVTRSERVLIQARKDAAAAALEAAKKEYGVKYSEVASAKQETKTSTKAEDKFSKHVEDVIAGDQEFFEEQGYGSFTQLMFTDERMLEEHIYPTATTEIDGQSHYITGINAGVIRYNPRMYPDKENVGRFFPEQPITEDEVIELFNLGAPGIPTLEELNALPRIEQVIWYAKLLEGTTIDQFQKVLGVTKEQAEYVQQYLTEGLQWDAWSAGLINGGESYTKLVGRTTSETKKAEVADKTDELEESTSRLISREVYNLAVQDDPLLESSWYDATDALDFTSEFLMSSLGIESSDFKYDESTKTTSFTSPTVEGEFQTKARALKEEFDLLNEAQIEALNEITKQVKNGELTLPEAQAQLTDILGEGNPLIELYAHNFQQIIDKQRTRQLKNFHTSSKTLESLQVPEQDDIISGLNSQMQRSLSYTGNVMSYEDFIGQLNLPDTAAVRDIYAGYIKRQADQWRTIAQDANDHLLLFLIDGPPALVEEYTTAIQEEIDYLSNNPTSFGASAALERMKQINYWAEEIGKGEAGIFANVSDEGMAEFFTLLNKDRGTYEWANNLKAWGIEYGVNLGDLEALVFEVYEIRLQNIIDETQVAIDQIAKLKEQNTKGFTFDEAIALVNQLKEIDPSATFDSIFNVNEQGIITLIDFGKTADQLYQSSLHDLSEQQKHLDKISKTIDGAKSKPVSFEDGEEWFISLNGYLSHIQTSINDASTSLEQDTVKAQAAAQQISQQYGLDLSAEELTSLAQAILDGKISSYQDLVDFYTNLRDNAQNAYEVFSKQAQDMIASISFDNWAEGFTNASGAKGLLSSGGSVSDLKDLWKKGYDDWNKKLLEGTDEQQKQAITWTKERIEALTPDQLASTGWELHYQDLPAGTPEGTPKKIDIAKTMEANGLNVPTAVGSEYWTSADYAKYYTAQSEALKSHGASLDAFGNLIITDWKKWGTYIAESYGFIENGKITNKDAYDAIMAEAKASQIQTMESFNNSMEEGFTSILQNWVETGEVSFDDVKNLIDTLQAQGALTSEEYNKILKAYEGVQNGVKDSVENLFKTISDAAFGSGIKWDASELYGAIEDAYTSLIKTLADALKSGIEGTLSATDFNSLAERYGLKSEDYISTATGRQLTRSGEAKTIAGMYNTAQANGSTWGLGAEVWETLKDSGSQFQTYEAIEEAITAIKEDSAAWAEAMGITEEQANDCLKVFEQIADAARLDPDNPLFNFMEQDPTEGYGAGIDEMLSNINKAKDGLQTLKDKGSIAAKDFVNMFDFMYSQTGANFKGGDIAWLNSLGISDAAIAKLEQGTGRTINTYRDFVNAMVQYSGKLGEVDGKVLLELGINIDTMAGGMGKSLEKVANDQIKFLEGIRDMLKAMKAMDAIGNIDLNFSIGVKDKEGKEHTLNFEQMINGLLGADGDTVQITIDGKNVTFDTSTLLSTLEAQLKADNVMGEELFNILFGESLDLSEINVLDALKGIDFSQFTEGQLQYISQGMLRAVQGIDPKKEPEKYRQAILDYIRTLYVDGEWIKDIPDIISSELEGKLNSSLFTDGKFKLSVDGRGDTTITWDSKTNEIKVQLKDGEKSLNEEAREAIQDAYQAEIDKQEGFEGVQVHVSSTGTVTYHVVNPQIKTEFGGENSTFDGTNYTGKKTVTIDGQEVELSYTASADGSSITFKAPDGSEYTQEQVNAAAQEALSAKGLDVVQTEGTNNLSLKTTVTEEGSPLEGIQTTLNLIYGLFSSGQVLSLSFDNTSAEATQTVLDAILAAWDTLVKLDGSTVTLNVNQGGNAGPQTPTPSPTGTENTNQTQSQGGVAVPLTIDTDGFISQLATLYTSITNNTAGVEPPVIKVIAKWQEGSPANLEADIKGQTFDQNIKRNYTNKDGWKQTGLSQDVEINYINNIPGTHDPNKNGDGGGDTDAKGNVALARGNVSNLLAGAAFARGTLMGELGPELYVQDGQYHIAGANGPEFVDLHNDAIVFNHLQTAKLLNKGHINSHGSPVTDERTAVAFATGNVSGPAHANSNIDDAIAAVEAAIAMWQNIANASINDMLNASDSGSGGGSDTIKAVTVELQEWYNLTRKIAEVEERINKLLAERENIEKRDGAAYLRNLREEQQYWREQLTYQTVLAQYQSAQLDRQREAIEQSEIWGQFFKFDSQGNIQFRNGNERDDGKGTLEFLQDLKGMSLEDQIKAIEKLGYSYTDADGNKLEGKDLVEQFLKDIDDQMKNYESLYDTVQQAETKLEQIKTNIEEVERQVRENQMDLEQDIYDTIVEAQEKVIDGLEEQKDLIEESNKAYIDGLNNALKAEKELYSKNESINDREQLQRQLSLLRRSGGSASEIAALEEQLNDMLKNEYFSNQEDMIKDIEEANEEQIRKLEEQIRLQEEALEYQKEHGLIWSQVAEIMSHDSDYILDFLQGNSTDFFAQSALQQEQMLTEWAHKIGIFTEDRELQNYKDEEADMWEGDKPQIFDSMDGELGTGDKKTSYGDFFNTLSEDNKKLVKDSYLQAYAKARQEGKTEEEARKIAQEEMKSTLGSLYDASLAPDNDPPSGQPDPGTGGGSKTMYVTGGKLNVREKPNKNSTKLGQLADGAKVTVLEKTNADWYKIKSGNLTGYVMSKYLTEGVSNTGGDPDGDTSGAGSGNRYVYAKVPYNKDYKEGSAQQGISTSSNDKNAIRKSIKSLVAKKTVESGGAKIPQFDTTGWEKWKLYGFSEGGIVDYTGPAIVHGTPSKPEAFLNAKQTAMISEAIKTTGDGGALDGIKATLAALNSTIKGIVNNNTNTTSSFTVAPGAVTIQVAELSDSYDVEELSKDVMNRIVAIASKSTNRGVNRR